MLRLCGEAEDKLAQELIQFELQVERDVIEPLFVLAEVGLGKTQPGAVGGGVSGSPRGAGCWLLLSPQLVSARPPARLPGQLPALLSCRPSWLLLFSVFLQGRGLNTFISETRFQAPNKGGCCLGFFFFFLFPPAANFLFFLILPNAFFFLSLLCLAKCHGLHSDFIAPS